jgi:hypothetical protein
MSRRIAVFVPIVLLFALGASGELTGVVINRDGAPVMGATVSVYPLEPSADRQARLLSENPERLALATGETNKDGVFRLDADVPVVDVLIRHAGYAPATVRMLKDEDVGAIALANAATKTGTVRGPGGVVAGARVVWRGRNGTEIVSVTDAEGRYSIPDPTEWASGVTVIAPGHAIFEETRMRAPIARPPGVDVRLEEGVSVSGRVVAADGKSPVGGATIAVDGWPLAASGEDGAFVARNAPSRWEEVRAIAGRQSAARTRRVDELVLRLEPTPRVSGVVRDADSRAPLAGVEVNVSEQAGPMRVIFGDGTGGHRAVTDAKGAWALDLPAGSYEVQARMPGYSFASVEVSLAAGAKADRAIPGTRLARLTGTVLDEDRQGVAAATVAPRRDGGMGFGPRMMMMTSPAWTGPDGRFVLRNVQPSDALRFEASKKGLPAGETDRIALSGGETRSGVVITIPRGIEVTGIVTDARGVPLSGVAVTSSPSRPGNRGMMQLVIGDLAGDDAAVLSDRDGLFSMRVRQGPADFSFRLAGYAPRRVTGVQVAPGVEPLEVAMEPGAAIEGRVVRADGSGVEGVNVGVIAEGAMASAVTLPDGSFLLEDLVAGPMMLMANKEDEFIQQVKRVTAPARDVVIELPPGVTVSGRVVDKETKKPVTDFQAGIQNDLRGGGMRIVGPASARSFRDEAGSFVLENVPAGRLQLRVTAAGYVAQSVPGLVAEEDKPIRDLLVELDRGTTISGKITGPDGRAIQGATVRIESEDLGPGMRGPGWGNQADAEGSYTLEAVEPGERTISFSARGYLDETRTVEVSGRTMKLDVTLGKGATVSGTVVTDTGAPVADAVVSVRGSAASGRTSARTDSGGNFRLEGIEPGLHTFEARKTGLADGQVENVDVRTGAPVRIVMPMGATITGRVTGVDSAELSRVQVVAISDGGDASAMVGSSGAFRIDGAPTGSVRVFARMTGFGGSNTETKTVEVQSGGQAVVDLEFRTDTLVSGRVTKNRRALDGAMVRFTPKSAAIQTRATATTDSRGEYELKGLAPGDYDVTVLGMQNLSPYTTSTRVDRSTSFDIDIETARVEGRVVDADTGQGIVAAEISLQPRGQAGGLLVGRGADSDPSGSFILDDVAPGAYTARASKTGYGQHVFDLEVATSGASGVEFKLASTDGARVRVVDGRDGRVLDAFARVTDLMGRTAWEGQLRGSDKGTKLPLAAGSYRLTVWASGYAPVVTGLSAPTQAAVVAVTPGGKLQIQADGDRARSGQLLGSDGAPVELSYFSRQAAIRINPGTSTIDAIAPGAYSLVVMREDGSVESTHPVTIMEGRTTTLRL